METIKSPDHSSLSVPIPEVMSECASAESRVSAEFGDCFMPEDDSESPSSASDSREDFCLVENVELGIVSARFTMELAGMVWNGLIRRQAEADSSSFTDKAAGLLNRLLPSFSDGAQLQVEMIGGMETQLTWRLHGVVAGAVCREQALADARQLRQSTRVILASLPHLKFVPNRTGQVERPAMRTAHFRVRLTPRSISLPVPLEAPIGFADIGRPGEARPSASRIGMAFPGARTFGSLIDSLLLSPCPIQLEVTLSPFTVDEEGLATLAAVSDLIRRNPRALARQFSGAHLDLDFILSCQAELQNWLRTPNGIRVECEISSQEPIPEPLAKLLGSHVFGGDVALLSLPAGPQNDCAPAVVSSPADRRPAAADLDISNCLRVGDSWPSFFPGPAAFSRGKIPRLFNHQRPGLVNRGLFLGRLAEDKTPVRLGQSERAQHVYVMGATGTGKSTLLFNMILQDIAAGRGVGMIDPHGDLYDQLLDAMPPSRVKNVILFNPGRSDCSPGINPLELDHPGASHQAGFIINELLKTFERLYDMRQCGGPMFETYFRNAMLLLLESGLRDVALTEFPLVFEDATFRSFLKERCRNPLVVGFWVNQAEKAKSDHALQNMIPYITSKLNAFLCNSTVRAIVGQTQSTINFRTAMDHQKIVLIKLPKGALGELNTQLLGSFLLSKIFVSAMSRADLTAAERTPFHLYVDEFQNFTNDTVAHMMSESRKYGLHLTLANQNLSQLKTHPGSQNILDAVLGNVGNLILFRIGPADAQKVWPYTEPEFGSLDLQGLPNFHAVTRLMSPHGPTRPFVFRSIPPVAGGNYKRVSRADWTQREKAFARSILEIDDDIARRRTAWKNPSRTDSTSAGKSEDCQAGTRGRATTSQILGR